MDFIKTRLEKPDNKRRIIYITYCGRFCIGWYIDNLFHEYGTSITTKNDMVLYWLYEDDIIPKDFNNEQKTCGW